MQQISLFLAAFILPVAITHHHLTQTSLGLSASDFCCPLVHSCVTVNDCAFCAIRPSDPSAAGGRDCRAYSRFPGGNNSLALGRTSRRRACAGSQPCLTPARTSRLALTGISPRPAPPRPISPPLARNCLAKLCGTPARPRPAPPNPARRPLSCRVQNSANIFCRFTHHHGLISLRSLETMRNCLKKMRGFTNKNSARWAPHQSLSCFSFRLQGSHSRPPAPDDPPPPRRATRANPETVLFVAEDLAVAEKAGRNSRRAARAQPKRSPTSSPPPGRAPSSRHASPAPSSRPRQGSHTVTPPGPQPGSAPALAALLAVPPGTANLGPAEVKESFCIIPKVFVKYFSILSVVAVAQLYAKPRPDRALTLFDFQIFGDNLGTATAPRFNLIWKTNLGTKHLDAPAAAGEGQPTPDDNRTHASFLDHTLPSIVSQARALLTPDERGFAAFYTYICRLEELGFEERGEIQVEMMHDDFKAFNIWVCNITGVSKKNLPVAYLNLVKRAVVLPALLCSKTQMGKDLHREIKDFEVKCHSVCDDGTKFSIGSITADAAQEAVLTLMDKRTALLKMAETFARLSGPAVAISNLDTLTEAAAGEVYTWSRKIWGHLNPPDGTLETLLAAAKAGDNLAIRAVEDKIYSVADLPKDAGAAWAAANQMIAQIGPSLRQATAGAAPRLPAAAAALHHCPGSGRRQLRRTCLMQLSSQ